MSSTRLHRLELFYYVARHGGIPQAARKMPYGIEPSSLSRQLCRLEREMELTLYQRHGFRLTQAGEKLFKFILPMFEDLPRLSREWKNERVESVRVGASPVILRDYLPPILESLHRLYPHVEINCSQGSQSEISGWLKDKSIDLAVTTLGADDAPQYHYEQLARLPLALLVRAGSKIRRASDLGPEAHLSERLISLPADHAITRCFRQGLAQRGLDWPLGMVANSLELVESYVRNGLGIGVSVALPNSPATSKGVRLVPLADFPQISLGLIWRHKSSEAIDRLAAELRQVSRKLGRGAGVSPDGSRGVPPRSRMEH